MVVVNIILGTMVIIVIRIEKTIQTIRSGIIQRHNLKRIYIYNHKTNMIVRMNAIDMVWKDTSHVPIIFPYVKKIVHMF